MQIEASNICEAWVRLLREAWENGRECAPRGKKIKELLHTQVIIDDLRNNILTHPLRDCNFRFMVAEWLWIQSGRDDVAWISRFNSKIREFSDDGKIFLGAYGPRLMEQLSWVIALLKKDPDTRQAVITIFEGCDFKTCGKDVPCTLSLQLLLRQDKLHGVLTMRSNDLWLGTPYDIFNWSQITNSIAGELGVDTGSFTLQAGSSHIYESDWEKARGVVGESLKDYYPGYRYPYFERSPMLERVAPTSICTSIENLALPNVVFGGRTYFEELTAQEQIYVQALHCPTKAAALQILRTL